MTAFAGSLASTGCAFPEFRDSSCPFSELSPHCSHTGFLSESHTHAPQEQYDHFLLLRLPWLPLPFQLPCVYEPWPHAAALPRGAMAGCRLYAVRATSRAGELA